MAFEKVKNFRSADYHLVIKYWDCRLCDRRGMDDQLAHTFQHHTMEGKTFKCLGCGEKFPDGKAFLRHFEEEHISLEWSCLRCGFVSSMFHLMSRHIKSCTSMP